MKHVKSFKKSSKSHSDITSKPLSCRFGLSYFDNCKNGPGIYWMENSQGHCLYVGKSKNLRLRMLTYRHLSLDRCSARFFELLRYTTAIKFLNVSTDQEAEHLYQEFISHKKPVFNLTTTQSSICAVYLISYFDSDTWVLELSEQLQTNLRGSSFGSFLACEETEHFYTAVLRAAWRQLHPSKDDPEYPGAICKNTDLSYFRFHKDNLDPQNIRLLKKSLESFLAGTSDLFLLKLQATVMQNTMSGFHSNWIKDDLDLLNFFYHHVLKQNNQVKNYFQLKDHIVDPQWLNALTIEA